MDKLRSHARLERYLQDPIYRTEMGLYFGLAVNALYIFIKFFTGIAFHSEWLIAFAVYYAVLTALRSFLAAYVRRQGIGRDLRAEYRRVRWVGVLLVPMNLALSVIIARMIGHNESYDYPGVLIYGMAAYVFYSVILAAVNVFRFRRHGSPVITAVKIVGLIAALVAMLSLEAAMLSRFGGEDGTLFRAQMLGISGLAVSVLILGMSGCMIIHATKKLQREENRHE